MQQWRPLFLPAATDATKENEILRVSSQNYSSPFIFCKPPSSATSTNSPRPTNELPRFGAGSPTPAKSSPADGDIFGGKMARTDDAELVAAHIAAKPLLTEEVFLRPKFQDSGIDKELCDLFVRWRNSIIPIQMKCQQDPAIRSGEKLFAWTGKQARAAFRRLGGTLNTIAERAFWCDHPSLGRVQFAAGELQPVHCIAVVEHRTKGLVLPSDLPLEIRDCPVTYLTLSDLAVLISELRAFPDIVSYLDARRNIPEIDLRRTGEEEILLGHSLLNQGSFPPNLSFAQRRRDFLERQPEFRRLLEMKRRADQECSVLEGMAASLRKRKSAGARQMQDILSGLGYTERQIVGRKLWEAKYEIQNSGKTVGMSHRLVVTPSCPDLVLVPAASVGLCGDDELSAIRKILGAVIALTRAPGAMLLLWRDKSPLFGFMLFSDYTPSDIDKANASLIHRLMIANQPTRDILDLPLSRGVACKQR
jgi:hypothetical protein